MDLTCLLGPVLLSIGGTGAVIYWRWRNAIQRARIDFKGDQP